MICQTHGLRHDTEALFAKLGAPSPHPLGDTRWLMTPCIVIEEESISVVRDRLLLLTFTNDAQVICGWPGAKRQDVFEFTVGAFRAFLSARDHSTGGAVMTCDETKPTEQAADQAEPGGDQAAEGQQAEPTTDAEPEKDATPEADQSE